MRRAALIALLPLTALAQATQPASAPASLPSGPLLTVPDGALEPLMERLDDPKSPTVVVHYGDSHSATGWFADALMKTLVGDASTSPGFVALAFPRYWSAKVRRQGKWKIQNWLRGKAEGPFGPLGVARVTRDPRAEMRLELEAPPKAEGAVTVKAFFNLEGATLPFKIENDGKVLARYTPPKEQKARPDAGPDEEVEDPPVGVLTVTPPRPDKEIKLVVDCGKRCPKRGTLRFYGFQVDYEGAVMSWDVLAVGGTTIRNPLYRGGGDQRGYLRQRAPHLFVLFYGTNSTGEEDFELDRYREKQVKLIRYLKETSPESTCLVVGLPDRSKRDSTCFLDEAQRRVLKKRRKRRSKADWAKLKEGRMARICDPDSLVKQRRRKKVYPVPEVETEAEWEAYKEACTYRTMPRVFEIAQVQREVAAEEGCLFFDTLRFMGGADSIQAWTCAEEPKAKFDLLHLSELGYRSLAEAIGRELNREMGR